MKKKKTNKEKFPTIYRIFIDWKTWVGIVSAILVVGVAFLGVDLYKNLVAKKDLEKQRETISSEIQFWKGVVKEYTDYRDGYFMIAVSEYKLGNKNESKKYLEKVLELDPNFKSGRALEELLY